jgi:hypothetical protein
MSSLAEFYCRQTHYDKAEPLYLKILEIRKNVLGKEHQDTLDSMNNLALLYILQDRHEEANQLGHEVLEISERVLGNEHPNTQRSEQYLVTNYIAWGKQKLTTMWQANLEETVRQRLWIDNIDKLFRYWRNHELSEDDEDYSWLITH